MLKQFRRKKASVNTMKPRCVIVIVAFYWISPSKIALKPCYDFKILFFETFDFFILTSASNIITLLQNQYPLITNASAKLPFRTAASYIIKHSNQCSFKVLRKK